MALPETQALMPLRARLLESFETALRPVGLLDRFQVAGIIATWWGEAQNDLKTLAARGFGGLGRGLDDEHRRGGRERLKENPLDHKLVRLLLPEHLDEIAELEAKKSELDATIKRRSQATTRMRKRKRPRRLCPRKS